MTEREYREILGASLKFHAILDPACSKDEMAVYSQMLTEKCIDMFNHLRESSHYREVAVFTTGRDDNEPQLSVYFKDEELYIGSFDPSSHTVNPCIDKNQLKNLEDQLFALSQRVDSLTIYSSEQRTVHISPAMKNMWEKHLQRWQEIEREHRSKWQIVEKLTPKTPQIYAKARHLLDESGAIYIQGGTKTSPALYLTKRAKDIIDGARDNQFKNVYDDMVTGEYIKWFKTHADKIDIKSVENGVITISPKAGPNKDLDIKFNTRTTCIDVVKNGKSLLKPGEHKDMTIIREVLREEKKSKIKKAREDEER